MYMSGAAHGFCGNEKIPHGPFDLCAVCNAEKFLTDEDSSLLGFYTIVGDQYTNQTPMGTKDGPPITNLRIESLESALRSYRYPRELWGWFITGAKMFHGLITKQDTVDWIGEVGKPFHMIEIEDVSP